jgi:hypothetical protein
MSRAMIFTKPRFKISFLHEWAWPMLQSAAAQAFVVAGL